MKKPLTTVHPEQPLANEQALLEHYRRHSLAQPSAAVDALILAAASAALARAKPVALPWSQRLQNWLFGPGHRLRWSVTFASLASIGLGLGLSLRTLQDLPPAYDLGEPLPAISAAPAPASAPLAEPMADGVAPMAKALPSQKQPLPSLTAGSGAPSNAASVGDKASGLSPAEPVQALGEVTSNSSVAAQRRALATDAKTLDSAAQSERKESSKAKAALSLTQGLREVQQLQRSGAWQQATEALQALQRQYPERDLTAELATLPAE